MAGAKWAGTKTNFDEAAAVDNQEAVEGNYSRAKSQHSIDPVTAPSGSSMLLPDIKWKKLATAELKKVRGPLGVGCGFSVMMFYSNCG